VKRLIQLRVCLAAAVLCAGSLAHAAAVPPAPSWSQRWTFTDLDGDSRPDVVRVALAGHDSLGYLYNLQFEMSSGGARRLIQVHSASPWGVRVIPRDADGDHDVDLVITGLFDHRPIAVWINDGHGFFDRAGTEQLGWTRPQESDLESTDFFSVQHAVLAATAPHSTPWLSRGQLEWHDSSTPAMALSDATLSDTLIAPHAQPRAPPLP
jgi:hypothetical protein